MAKKVNAVTIPLYVLFAAGAITCGVLEHMILTVKMWILVIVCLACMFIIGIIRAGLLKKARKNQVADNDFRVVNVQPTKVEGEPTTNVNEPLPLIHVDNVNEKKVVVTLYKEKVLPTDCVGKVVK